jgi:cytoskeletal protein CcmA (bactofilin family)
MWKHREEAPRSTSGSGSVPPPLQPAMFPGEFDRTRGELPPVKDAPVSVGKSIVIKGELSGDEDLTIEGRVEGTIELRNHVLTIGSNGHVEAKVVAKSIVVLGRVTGNLTATEKVDIREEGSVEGDIMAPRVAIADGAEFRGSVDMQRKAPAPSMDQGVGSLTLDAKAPLPTMTAGNGEVARV